MLFCEPFAHEGLSCKIFPSPFPAFSRTSFTRTCFNKLFYNPLHPFPKGDLVAALLRYVIISLFKKRFTIYVIKNCNYFNACNTTGRLPGRVSVGLKTWIAFLSVTGKYGILCNRSREILGDVQPIYCKWAAYISLSWILRHSG